MKSLDKKLLRNAKGLINTILSQTIENPNNPESMNFFQGDAYRFYFLMSFMNEFFKGSDISQEFAISLVPPKYASRIKRLQILKQAVRLGYITESQSNVDKRRRIYKPSDTLIDDFLKYADHMTEANMRKAG
ncbi:MAG: hypothetical protein CMD75_02645 [Gammaproteobacteria bacterium]|nr:hypothetical protein [Gammaproteobacteria bacterium]